MHRIFFACIVAWSCPTAAATLRSTTTLDQPQVRIADLFDEAGPAGPRVLGPGPAPGTRIVVEAAQAAAIARQFGIAWRPSTNTERVIIDRPGRLIAREDVVTILRQALEGVGAPVEADIELPGFSAPLVALEASVQTTIEQIDYDAGVGRFTATLAITSAAEPIQRMRLSGRVVEMSDLLVVTHRLAAGTVIGHDDLQMARVRATPSRGEVVHDVTQAIGMEVRRIALPGQPLLLADIGRPVVMQKNTRVTMLLQAPGLSLAALGVAMEAGGMGERISVLNPASGAIVEAEIIGRDQVRVSPGSVSRLPSRNLPVQVSQR